MSVRLIRHYLIAAVGAMLAAWTLSSAHCLTSAGYVIALPILIYALSWLIRENRRSRNSATVPFRLAILQKRFRKPLPLLYLVAATMILVGGILYPPNNFDALTYRLPRMLNWIAEKQWHWIPTANERMNYSATGWEWIAMPLFILRSDRGLFLINTIGFLLMPGLLFSIFRRVGIAGRVAWAWMWILPLGYGYATQAGGIGNDFTGTIFCLTSLYFGLRARTSMCVKDVWLCGLAAAITTGIKTSNLPLMLPCLVAVWPALKVLSQRWAIGILMLGIGFLVSAGPIAVVNQSHTGSWTGDPQNRYHLQITNPAAALLGNGILLTQQSFFPPVLPGARRVERWFDDHLPSSWKKLLKNDFPRYELNRLNELPQEEGAGLGLGITLLLLASMVCGLRATLKQNPTGFPRVALVIGAAAWIASLVYLLKMGSEATARLMLAYFPLTVIPILAFPGLAGMLRRRWWKALAVFASLSVFPALVLSPSRPLLPVESISARLSERFPDSGTLQRAHMVYSSYAHRNDLLAPLRDKLPESAMRIGFIAGSNDTDYSLWKPFGHRRVVWMYRDQRLLDLPDNVEWLIIKRNFWPELSDEPLADWINRHNGEIPFCTDLISRIAAGEETWCVVHLPAHVSR
jgi:hypothetical protein